MATWTIKGEAGKRLNAVERTVQGLGMTSAKLRHNALADDEFIYTVPITTTAGGGIDGVNRIPEAGQVVELFRNGTRKFIGNAMFPDLSLDSVTVRVVGPFYWMRMLPVISEPGGAVDAGTDADGTRPVVVFPQQNLRESLRTLFNSARDAGVPIQTIGSGEVADFMSAMFTTMKTTLSGNSWADALTEMLKWCLDAVPWYDYAGTAAKAMVTRRDAMDPLTLSVGENILMDGFSIRPRLDLKVGRTELHYMTRNPTTGRPRAARQSFGSGSRSQLVVVSGNDVADLVPPDDFDSVKIRTGIGPLPDNNYVVKRAGTISSLITSNGYYGGIGSYVSGYDGWQWSRIGAKYDSENFGPTRVLNLDGTTAATVGKYLLLTNDQPDWLTKAPYKAKKVKLAGTWLGVWDWGDGDAVPPAGFLAWYKAASPEYRGDWWRDEPPLLPPSSGPSGAVNRKWFAIPFECDGVLVSEQYVATTTVYRPWQWDYLEPPANLAENLKGCQDWLPWEGTIPTIESDVTGNNLLNMKIRVANWLPECAAMDALLKSVETDILNNRVTYTLGAPARVDYGSFIGRMRSQRIDRIKYL